MKLIIDGHLTAISTLADKSVKVTFTTQEIDSSKAGELFQLRNEYCKILISNTNISKVEEELVDKTDIAQTGKQKTPSQRLRSVLYIAHQQSGMDMSFDDYYRTEMENFIQTIKARLE